MTNSKSDLSAYSHEADVGIASIKARFSRERISEAEVAAFCHGLRGYTWRNYHETVLEPDLTPLPSGYRNFRVRDARDGVVLGTTWWVDSTGSSMRANVSHRGLVGTIVSRRPSARSVVAKVMSSFVFEEVDEWHSTRVIPGAEPGMLELVVDIKTRARELIVNGEPFPPHIVAFFASHAPSRARRGTTSR